MKGKRYLLVIGILIFSMLVGNSAWAVSSHLYKDTTGKWWEQSVAECSAADLVGGRGQGIFDPKASVSQIEAIVFLNRALGYRTEADDYSMSAGDYNFPANFPEWAKKNIAFAADKKYISKSGIPSMQPKNAATRAEIAVLFANALNLSADGYKLTFKDKDQIHSSLQSFVAAAVKHGVMSGRPDNTFDPNAAVTRGEMAAIISRLFENGKINPNPSKYYIAKISKVDTAGQKITVLRNSQSVTLNLEEDTLFYWDGKRVSLDSLKVNENIRIALGSTGKVLYLANTKASTSGSVSVTTTYSGTIKGLTSGSQWLLSFQPDTGSLTSYPLVSSVKITQNGTTKDMAALAIGTRVEITVTNGSVTEIKILSAVVDNGKKGYVVNMYLDYFTVRYDDGTKEEINKSNVSTTFYQLSRGQRVSITKLGNIVSSIVPLNEAKKIFGDVIKINSSSITIEDGDGYERTFDLASSYKVKDKDGDSMDLEDVEEEEFVEIELNSKDEAVTIKLNDGSSSSSSALEGEVTKLVTSGNWKITIEKYDGKTKTYDVEDDVDVYEDGDNADFDDIRKGDYVKLKLDSSDDVTKIDILDVEIVKGEVIEVDDTGSWGITIENSSGKEKTYDVSKNVDVYEGSKSRDFDDISKRDYVKLVIDNDSDDVISIIITDEESASSYEGTITKLNEDEITIKGSSTKTYDLANDVEIEKDSNEIDLEEVLIGSEVKLTIDDDEVIKIEITDDEDIEVEGELYSVSSRYIYLKQDNGKHKLYFADDVELEDDDGEEVDLDDLEDYEGDDVVIELKDGEIETLEIQ
ncbi:hypothetical protein JCM14036_08800 [Desulfotomaculum defluvii]